MAGLIFLPPGILFLSFSSDAGKQSPAPSASFPIPGLSVRARLEGEEGNFFRYSLVNYHSAPLWIVGMGRNSKGPDHVLESVFMLDAYSGAAEPPLKQFNSPIKAKYIFFKTGDSDSLLSEPVVPYSAPSSVLPSQELFHEWEKKLPEGCKKTGVGWTLSPGDLHLDQLLVIGEGAELLLPAGTNIFLGPEGGILSRSPIRILGTPENPVRIEGKTRFNQGITILDAGGRSEIFHAHFSNLNALHRGPWNLNAAVQFQNSELRIKFCSFKQTQATETLGMISSLLEMDSCSFHDNAGDAVDLDACKGSILHSEFVSCGMDGLDFSKSEFEIRGVVIRQVKDKGLSAGENSRLQIRDLVVSECKSALTSKELSQVDAENVEMNSGKTGIEVYFGKEEFGPASLSVRNLKHQNLENMYSVEEGSELKIDGQAQAGKAK